MTSCLLGSAFDVDFDQHVELQPLWNQEISLPRDILNVQRRILDLIAANNVNLIPAAEPLQLSTAHGLHMVRKQHGTRCLAMEYSIGNHTSMETSPSSLWYGTFTTERHAFARTHSGGLSQLHLDPFPLWQQREACSRRQLVLDGTYH
jgi:hypothetical protein